MGGGRVCLDRGRPGDLRVGAARAGVPEGGDAESAVHVAADHERRADGIWGGLVRDQGRAARARRGSPAAVRPEGSMNRVMLASVTVFLIRDCNVGGPRPAAGLIQGTWGGNNAGLMASDSSAHVHIGCTAGDTKQALV